MIIYLVKYQSTFMVSYVATYNQFVDISLQCNMFIVLYINYKILLVKQEMLDMCS